MFHGEKTEQSTEFHENLNAVFLLFCFFCFVFFCVVCFVFFFIIVFSFFASFVGVVVVCVVFVDVVFG